MDNDPQISVLMPNFNYASYLVESIESILGQTLRDFEFIIIDDASTDASRDIIEDYVHKDSRIKFYCNKSNIGLALTLNKGIDLCNGKFIARMDSDDISLPDRLQKQLDFLTKKNLDICGGRCQRFGEVIYDFSAHLPESEEELMALLPFTPVLIHPTFFGKTSLFRKYYYRNGFTGCEDYDFCIRIIADKVKVGNLPEPILKFRAHSERSQPLDSSYAKTLGELMVRALDVSGVPYCAKEKELHRRLFSKNSLRGSFELIAVVLWLNKVMTYTLKKHANPKIVDAYMLYFRKILENNTGSCPFAWSFYRIIKKINLFEFKERII